MEIVRRNCKVWFFDFDRTDREANRNRAAPIATAVERHAAAELFGIGQHLRRFIKHDHGGVFVSAAIVFALGHAVERFAVSAFGEVIDLQSRGAGPNSSFAPDVFVAPLADEVINGLLLLRLHDRGARRLLLLPGWRRLSWLLARLRLIRLRRGGGALAAPSPARLSVTSKVTVCPPTSSTPCPVRFSPSSLKV